MISETANQFAVFARLLLVGSGFGGAFSLVKLVLSKFSFMRKIKLVLYIFAAVISGMAYIFLVLSFPFAVDFQAYPLVFVGGIFCGKFIFDTIVALFENIWYNTKKKAYIKRLFKKK